MVGHLNRLPTLFEVLSRKTLPPVDLFTFYVYMRDQQRSVDFLDFWLDVAQHMSLCRHYVREMHRSVLADTPELDKAGSKRPSQERLSTSQFDEEKGFHDDRRMSAFLRENAQYDQDGNTTSERTGTRGGMTTSSSDPSALHADTPKTVTRNDIRKSAERILVLYLIPNAEREIVLPPQVLERITRAIEEEGRDDPEVFDEAKDYVFQAMERDAFRGFLKAKALGNIVPSSALLRLVIGLLGMFGGFWAAFAMIFLDIGPRATRLWVILPFAVGIYGLVCHQYMMDPIYAALGIFEYQLFKFMKVEEPYVKRLLMKRAIWVTAIIVFLVAALVVLFTFVPGKRL